MTYYNSSNAGFEVVADPTTNLTEVYVDSPTLVATYFSGVSGGGIDKWADLNQEKQ